MSVYNVHYSYVGCFFLLNMLLGGCSRTGQVIYLGNQSAPCAFNETLHFNKNQNPPTSNPPPPFFLTFSVFCLCCGSHRLAALKQKQLRNPVGRPTAETPAANRRAACKICNRRTDARVSSDVCSRSRPPQRRLKKCVTDGAEVERRRCWRIH